MSETTHTPGPFVVQAANGKLGYALFFDIVSDTGIVTSTWAANPIEQQKVDADLFAAAPDMLAALTELVNPDDFDQHPDDFASEWHRARAAIAKATGAAP